MEREANVNKFTLPGTEDKDKSISSQVLEYYQKHSLNPELPKYFSGTPSSFKPENWSEFSVRRADNWFDPSNIKPGDFKELTVAVNSEEVEEARIEPHLNIDNVHATSPASSVTSNRKLEWDNGADIGYSNVSTHKILHKSISLPVLTDVEHEKLQPNLLKYDGKSQIKQFRSEHSSTSDLISNSQLCSCKKQSLLISFNPAYSSTTSESVKSLKRTYISSSSSESIRQEQQFSSKDSSDSSSETHESGSILNFLRGRFGLPIAESTPLIRIEQFSDSNVFYDTPKLSKPKQEGIFENLPTNTLGEKLSNSCEDLSSPAKNNTAKKWSSQIDLSMVDRVSHYKNMKVLKLCASKPVVVECLNSEPPTGENKFIQTSLPRNASIAVQTDFNFNSARFKRASPKDRQSVVYICHSDASDKDENTHSSSTQTNSNVLSNCNSFEYLYGADYDQNFQKGEEIKASVKYEADAVRKLLMSNLKRCPPKSDLATTTPDSEKTTSRNSESTSKETPLTESLSSIKSSSQKGILHLSKPADVRSSTQSSSKDSLSVEMRLPAQTTPKESPLTELLSSKQSGRLITDLENKLILLQRLIKSTKYNSATKKYYLQKIVTKIVDNKYVDDSSGSTDTPHNVKYPKTKYTDAINFHPTSGSSAGTSKSNHQFKEARLQDNKPWKPVQHTFCKENAVNMSPKLRVVPRKLQTETFVNEILPTKPQELKITGTNFVPIQVIRDGSDRLQRNPLFTLPNSDVFVAEDVKNIGDHSKGSSNSTANELYEELRPTVSQVATPIVSSLSDSKKTGSDGSKSNGRSWREDKTRSEQLLETKFHPDKDSTNKDQLATFAKKEREHQLYWINNEISHLNKLKKLLEKKRPPMDKDAEQKVLSTIVQKPFVEDMKGIQKSTTVYVLTTEKHCNRRTCNNPNCHACSSRSRSSRPGSSNCDKNCCRCTDKNCCRCKENLGTFDHVREVAPASRNHQQNFVEIGSEKVDLKRARLVSNEQFTTNNLDQPRKTSIRRYTFEIPLEEDTTTDDYECVPQCAAACSRGLQKCPARSIPSDDYECVPQCAAACSRGLQKCPARSRVSSTSPTTSPRTSPKTSPRTSPRVSPQISPRASPVHSVRRSSRASSRVSSKLSSKGSRRVSPSESPRVSPKTSPTVTGNAKTSRLIQELVITDEITDKSSKQNSLPVISCTSANDCSCSSSSASTSTSDGSSSTTQLCECCKREPVPKTSKHESKEPKEKYILCHPCYNRNGGYSGENTRYHYPGHVCQCYTAMQTDTVQRIHETIKELDDLEKEEDICKCASKKQAASGYCKRCKCKLDDECFAKKGGLAYDLTLESDEEKKKSHKHKKKKCLPEVRIRVESPRKSKSHRSTNSHKSTHKQKCRCCKCNNSEEEDEEAKEDAMTVKSKHKKHKSKKRSTIQDYLYANKPKFVAAADERRQCMLDLAYLRGKRNEKYKQLMALANNLPGPTNAPKKRLRSNIEIRHLFDPKEMVQKTAKKYKKLPEVQQKMIDNRERQIKQANRLLADMFNRKLQEHVLKGRLTLPPDANIINLY